MKKSLFKFLKILIIGNFLFLLIPIGKSQTIDNQKKVDSLNKHREELLQQIDNIDKELIKLQNESERIKNLNSASSSIDYIAKPPCKIRASDSPMTDVLMVIDKETKVTLLKYIDSGYWFVKCGDVTGYISDLYVSETEDIKKFKLNFTTKQNNDLKYIDETFSGLFWIGMTKTQARTSLGSPDNTNTTVGSWGTNEMWVYRNKNLYLFFENGYLTSYQEDN